MNKSSLLSQNIIGAVIILLAEPLILMLIWNAFIPGIFGLPTLGYWSAIGLSAVCSILFK
jgi:hypothetical protein